MGVLLNDAALEYLYWGNAVLTAKPLTIAGWMNRDDNTVYCALASIANSASDTNYLGVRCTASTHPQPHQTTLWVRNGGASIAVYSGAGNTAPPVGSWFHMAGTIDASFNKYAYMNGGRGTVDSTSVTPSGLDITGIGALLRSSKTWYMSGSIAELGFWNIDLTIAEIASLAKGFSPLLIRPQNLVAYWPLIREGAAGVYIDRVGGRATIEVNGSATSPHPPVFYPQGPQISSVVPISLPILPLAMHHYRNMRSA